MIWLNKVEVLLGDKIWISAIDGILYVREFGEVGRFRDLVNVNSGILSELIGSAGVVIPDCGISLEVEVRRLHVRQLDGF